ncbi:MAG TPA: OpgC domain-containing protein [Chloroflexota bacterium]|nr:OpgC domain-containing protein [Chloroflexota bacterium]
MIPDSWAYEPELNRDLRLDMLRGACVLGMIVNHVGGPSWARTVTQSNGTFFTPAEGFVFLSGYVVGRVYRSYQQKSGLRDAMAKAVKRSITLYKLTTVLSLGFGAALAVNGCPKANITARREFVRDVVLLRRTLYLTDVPLLYAQLMAAAAGALWLLAHSRVKTLLALSASLWAAYQIAPHKAGKLPWPIAENEVFHFAAWQLYFMVGLTAGYHGPAVARALRRVALPAVLGSAAGFATLLALEAEGGSHPWIERLAGKGSAGPLRLMACTFVFPLAYLLATYMWRPLRKYLGPLLLPLGQNSLYAYTMHIVLIGLLWKPLERLSRSKTLSCIAQLSSVAAIRWLIGKRFLFRVVPR